jgi:hypothetical protein
LRVRELVSVIQVQVRAAKPKLKAAIDQVTRDAKLAPKI